MLENPDGDRAWEIENVQGDQGGSKAVSLNHFGYGNVGEQDALITPNLDFSQYSNVELSFDHAYAIDELTPTSDTLLVEISTDCGQTYTS